ncbi:2867_t:CDS:2 [Ambispora gerdemannii]|uniref:2867_t:CDS:1 n=1 Tax=Ambispora gerdemannii TaxID=144530 RepID=A0A9N9DGE9_9GLOM|nr:2867_t:CDS:2 [Ambispora gerdemannii]
MLSPLSVHHSPYHSPFTTLHTTLRSPLSVDFKYYSTLSPPLPEAPKKAKDAGAILAYGDFTIIVQADLYCNEKSGESCWDHCLEQAFQARDQLPEVISLRCRASGRINLLDKAYALFYEAG